MPAKINIERMMHRNSIAVMGETAASYCLVKLIPTGEASAGKSLGLNLALVLDVSGSMYEEDGTGVSRLKRIQKAARSALDMLKPDDTMAVVAFAYNSQVVLPSTSISEKQKIIDAVDKIDMYDVDPGGTAMDQGIQLGMDEVAKKAGAGKLSQVVVLTDGETSGEHLCRQLAQQAAQKKIHLTVMGVGTEWNSALIKDLAKLSEGKWYYIDVNEKDDAQRIFVEEFESLAAAGFLNVEMHLRPTKDVVLKRIRQVVPEIKQLNLAEPEARHYLAQLGTLERDKSSRYILDLTLPKRPDGKFVIAQLEISFDPGTGKRESGHCSAGNAVHVERTRVH